MKLKVGDKVRVLDTLEDDETPSWIDQTGEVVETGNNDVVVSFKSGGGWTKYGHQHCWWIAQKHLEKVEKKTKKAPTKRTQEYKGNGKHMWEPVTADGHHPATSRLRVPGGWLYGFDNSVAVTFVPMPEVVKHKV